MLKYITLFCLVLAQAWSMETSEEQDACTQESGMISSYSEIYEVPVKLTYVFKSNSSNYARKKDVHTLAMSMPAEGEVSPDSCANMYLVEYLKISIGDPLVERQLCLTIWWVSENVIKIFWSWDQLAGLNKIVRPFQNNQNTTDLFTLLAQDFRLIYGSCPETYINVCKRMLFSFDQPPSNMTNIFAGASLQQ